MSPLDVVEQASADSFPASDPPGWSASPAAPSASTVVPEETRAYSGPNTLRWKRIMLGVLAAGAVIGVVFAIRAIRR